MSSLRTRDAGDSALLLDLDDVIDTRVNSRAIAIAHTITEAAVAGVRDVVPTFRSVAVYFDPLAADLARLATVVAGVGDRAGSAAGGRTFEVPVVYGGDFGPDLAGVAGFAGLTEEQVVDLHAARPYRVFMLGFLPGFPYLGVVDDRIAAPRHATPKLRVAGGSVGIAGRQTGIYPGESPGGWQIIGRTSVPLFDPACTPPALLAPGDTVRFVPGREGDSSVGGGRGLPGGSSLDADRRRIGAEGGRPISRRVTVLSPGLLTTIQDAGRWGHQASGVPVAGPLDPFSHRLANALVGNDRGAAALEITLTGPELRLEDDAHLAITGADLAPTLDGSPVPMNEALAGRAGSILRFGVRRRGARTYLAFGGGVSVAPVLGSRATHVLSGLGGLHGRALKAGDTIPLGLPRGEITRRRYTPEPRARSPVTTLRVMAGPQDDVFPPSVIDRLVHSRFAIAPESNRMGYRLSGAKMPATHDGTMISTSTFTGAIQVPPSGEPVLLMADRQTTGGYPQLATVIAADIGAAGQLAPGDHVAFELCSRGAALAALVRQEGALLALE